MTTWGDGLLRHIVRDIQGMKSFTRSATVCGLWAARPLLDEDVITCFACIEYQRMRDALERALQEITW